MRKIKITLVIIFACLISTHDVLSQIISPTGNNRKPSSQLIYFYEDARGNHDSNIQVTNTNDTTGIWVHVQLFRSYDPDNDDTQAGDKVICEERNFVDFLTPNDTHVYDIDGETGDDPFPKNIGENETTPGESTSINPISADAGFIVITPVVSESDLSAISFQHLTGNTFSDGTPSTAANAMGRDAVDFTTGEILEDSIVLDGVNNGFIVIQPEELLFNFVTDSDNDPDDIDSIVAAIVFSDNYSEAGLLGYQAVPSSVNWTSFIFDFKEDPTSCGVRNLECFVTLGINDTIGQEVDDLNVQGNEFDDALCPGATTPEYDPMDTLSDPDGMVKDIFFGWTRIFVSGLGDFDNHIGYFAMDDDPEGGHYMITKGERTEIITEPPEEDCSVEGDEDEDGFADCLDTDCATDESCETGEEECADELDNDEDGQADCADLGCDGFAGCEFGTETSCEDGIDNDADGAVDSDDMDCQEETTGGDGGDGGGCIVASTATVSTSAVNFLILMLPFIGVLGIRRIRNRK